MRYQFFGPKPPTDWDAIRRQLNGLGIVSPGPGNRIEVIPARCQYNWAEGSRAVEARRGAATMRSRSYAHWTSMHVITLMNLQLALAPVREATRG